MLSLSQLLYSIEMTPILESEGDNKAPLKELKTKEEALQWFEEVRFKSDPELPKDTVDKIKSTIDKLYDYAAENNKPAPIVAGYEKSPNKYTFRRWISREPSLKPLTDDIISRDSKRAKKYHDTSLLKVKEFPSSTEMEYVLAISMNYKASGEKDIEGCVRYALYGDDGKEDPEIIKKYTDWCEKNINDVKSYSKNMDVPKGVKYRKLTNNEVKKDISDEYKEIGAFNKQPNNTPKTDIIGSNGQKISVKKSIGAQAMSGAKNEAIATIMIGLKAAGESGSEEAKKIFKELNDHDWNGTDKERNAKLNKVLEEIFKNKKYRDKFIYGCLTESLTGATKFKENSDAVPDTMLTFDLSTKSAMQEDVHDYINGTYNGIMNNIKDLSDEEAANKLKSTFTINHKSANKTWANLRIIMGKHEKPFTKEQTKVSDEINDVFKEITKNHKIGKGSKDSKEICLGEEEVKDDKTGKTIKVTIYTGPRGGKYYKNSEGNKTYV